MPEVDMATGLAHHLRDLAQKVEAGELCNGEVWDRLHADNPNATPPDRLRIQFRLEDGTGERVTYRPSERPCVTHTRVAEVYEDGGWQQVEQRWCTGVFVDGELLDGDRGVQTGP